jgi:hypothetical protein
MIWPKSILIHKDVWLPTNNINWENRKDSDFNHCSYCGSISPEDFYNLLKDDSNLVELADQKYGFPHKFYIYLLNGQMFKFYTRHFVDIVDKKTVDTILDLIKEKLHINLMSHLDVM